MSFPPFYVLPLLAGMLYAVSAICLKRAFALDAGLMRSVFVSNIVMGLAFAPIAPIFGDGLPPLRDWVWPGICALTFFSGQTLTFLAVRLGDVSVQTPVMGAKVLLVAVFSFLLFGEKIPPEWWSGAALATLAIFLMGISDLSNPRRAIGAIALAILSCGFFALTDSLVPKFAAKVGPSNFITLTFGINALLSFALIPFFRAPLRAIPRAGWRPLGLSCLFNSSQALLMAIALSVFGQPTAVNILFSARGLWSVLLIAFAGAWFGIPERHRSRKTHVLRFSGATLLTTAVVLVLMAG